MKKKVALVVQRYGKEVNGGAELEARLYAERLTAHYDVTVYTTCAIDYQTWKNEYPEGEEILNDVRIVRFPNDCERNIEEFSKINAEICEKTEKGEEISRELQEEWLIKQGPYCPKLIEAIESHKDEFDTFLFMTFLYYTQFYGTLAVPEKAVLIPTAHDDVYLRIPIFRDLFRAPKALLFNSPSERDLVHKVFENDSIPDALGGCGVGVPDEIDFLGFRERHELPAKYAVYVGRVDIDKGCGEMIEYIRRYNQYRKSQNKSIIPLVMVGNNAMGIEPSEDVYPLGFVSENDKYAAMKESILLIMPSRHESLSIVVLEAFALNRPVLVTSYCDTLKDHCIYSDGGFYYSDFEEFLKCMDFFLRHPVQRAQMGRNGEYYCHCNYSWDDIMRRIERLIEL